MPRDPRRKEYTICTAVVADAVFAMRRYGDPTSPHGLEL